LGKIILGLILALIVAGFWQTCNSQVVLSRRGTATEEDTLAFVVSALETGSDILADTATISLTDRDNKGLFIHISGGGFSYTSVSSVTCLETAEAATLIDSSTSDILQAAAFHLVDSKLPSSGTCRIRVAYTASVYSTIGLLFYAGVNQTTPMDSAGTFEDCGSTTTTASSGSIAMRWDWTTNACSGHVAYRARGKTSGTRRQDVVVIYEDAASIAAYSGQTEFYSDETISVAHGGSSYK
jgi:hypothetical protein